MFALEEGTLDPSALKRSVRKEQMVLSVPSICSQAAGNPVVQVGEHQLQVREYSVETWRKEIMSRQVKVHTILPGIQS